MKTKIIQSKDLDIQCWLPNRYLHCCEDCDRVQRCDLPESWKGKLKILDQQIEKAKKTIKKWEEEKSDLSSIFK